MLHCARRISISSCPSARPRGGRVVRTPQTAERSVGSARPRLKEWRRTHLPMTAAAWCSHQARAAQPLLEGHNDAGQQRRAGSHQKVIVRAMVVGMVQPLKGRDAAARRAPSSSPSWWRKSSSKPPSRPGTNQYASARIDAKCISREMAGSSFRMSKRAASLKHSPCRIQEPHRCDEAADAYSNSRPQTRRAAAAGKPERLNVKQRKADARDERLVRLRRSRRRRAR